MDLDKYPKQVSSLVTRLNKLFPSASIRVDAPHDYKNTFFIDIVWEDRRIYVKWKEDDGFELNASSQTFEESVINKQITSLLPDPNNFLLSKDKKLITRVSKWVTNEYFIFSFFVISSWVIGIVTGIIIGKHVL